MLVNIQGRNMKVTPALKSYALEKVSVLNKYLDFNMRVHFTLSTHKFRQRAEVAVTGKGIATSIPGKSSGHLDWSLVDAIAVRDQDILVLQSNRRIFHYLPGDAYTAGSMEKVLRLVGDQVPVVRIS